MADALFLAFSVAFFAAVSLYVASLDRMLGRDAADGDLPEAR